MRNALGIAILIIVAFFSTRSLFFTKELVQKKAHLDDCLSLEQKIAEFGPSEGENEKLEECNKPIKERYEAALVDTGKFLGDAENAPEGALAFYKGFGDQKSVTVYNDKIKFESKVPSPFGTGVIMFKDIKSLTDEMDPLGSIEIEYSGERSMMFKFSFSIYEKGVLVSPEGRAEKKKLFELLNELWEKNK